MKILAQEEIPGLLSSPKRANFLVAGFANYGVIAASCVISSRASARMRRYTPVSSSLTSPRRKREGGRVPIEVALRHRKSNY